MPPKSKSASALGKAVIRQRFKGQRRPMEGDTTLHTTDLAEEAPKWTQLQSVTHEGDLEAFLRTAELAGHEFTAERRNVQIVGQDHADNPFLLDSEQEREVLQRQEAHQQRLTVPRRPAWDSTTTREALYQAEKEAFLHWRRGLAQLEETEGLLLTPFERNLEVWRQLWRVIERSSLVVQIVDARDPLFFRSVDLEKYVREVDSTKRNLLLVNKADLLNDAQRTQWADYFDAHNIAYSFFSAKIAAEEEEEETKEQDEQANADSLSLPTSHSQRATPASLPSRIHILSAPELMDLFKRECPRVDTAGTSADQPSGPKRPLQTIGLVGYPNVGKSSTINALLGAKRVAVGATPGKTKHFQTLFLDDDTLLCDCPGLVFPSFATTAAEMVCNGVLPIDQTREYTGPAALVAQRVPQWVLEAIYGIKIRIKPLEEGGTGIPTAEELLIALAVARGFTKAGQGNPDESRSARLILKDYIAGKLLYNHPPPDSAISGKEFNAALYDPKSLSKQTHHLVVDADGEYVIKSAAERRQKANAVTSVKVQSMDAKFFNHSAEAARLMPKTVGKFGKQTLTRAGMYPHHRMVDDQGRPLVTGDREAIEQVFGQHLSISGVPKKSFKKGKKHVKKRSGQGYDD